MMQAGAMLHGRDAGFTLLELLVALAIFGLLASLSYGGLQTVMNQQEQTEQAGDELAEVQKLYMLMQRDIEQIALRPVRDEYGDEQAALLGGDTLQLTRAGWRNPAGRPRSSLQRVAYAFEEEELVRYTWLVLDRAQDSQAIRQPLSEAVEDLRVRYLGSAGEWSEQWPPAEAVVNPDVEPEALPRVLEITLDHKRYGELQWLFQLPLAEVARIDLPAVEGAPPEGEAAGDDDTGNDNTPESSQDDDEEAG